MHKTEHPNVKGYIDVFSKTNDGLLFKGWSFHAQHKTCEVRLTYQVDNIVRYAYNIFKDISNKREDVCKFYRFTCQDYLFCGWVFHLIAENIQHITLEMFFEDTWNPVFHVVVSDENKKDNNTNNEKEDLSENVIEEHDITPGNGETLVVKRMTYVPSFVVVDDFYEDPNAIRNFALEQQFSYHPDYHKGKRTDKEFRFHGLKEAFERVLQCKIANWENYPVNGCFQICVCGDPLVYHVDLQQYAGIIFLTPDSPPESGTTFYRSKFTKQIKLHSESDYGVVFKNGHLDPSDFDVVDVVGNLYNRLVLFDAQMIHAASSYFGQQLDNGRLFQLFFFDLERS